MNVVKITDVDGTTVSSGMSNALILSGHDMGNAAGAPACVGVADWYGAECIEAAPASSDARGGALKLVHAVFDNLDRDRGFRRIGPVRIQRETVTGGLRNGSSIGPLKDPCAVRFPFGQFPMFLEPGVENQVRFGGTLPGTLRGAFYSDDPNEAVVVKLFVQRPNAIDVFYNN